MSCVIRQAENIRFCNHFQLANPHDMIITMEKKYWLRGGIALVAIQLGYTIVEDVFSTSPQGFLERILEDILFPLNLVGLGFIFAFGAVAGLLYGRIRNKNAAVSTIPLEEQKRKRSKIILWVIVAIIIVPPLLFFLPWFLISSYCTIDSLLAGQKTCDNFFDY